MKTIQKRFLLFLIACIGSRVLFAVAAKNASTAVLKYLGYLALLPAIGFTYLFVTGERKTGPEVFGGKIWWNCLRPVHALMYFIFSYSAITGNRNAWIFLLVDVFIGLTAFLFHHYIEGNFGKLFN
jgi:hypothetical protein